MRYESAETDNRYVEYNFSGAVDPAKSYDGRVAKQGWAAELSAAQQLTDQLNVFAGYDRVYRYPSLDETASYQGFPLSDPLNEGLDPEHGNNFEVGARFEGREWACTFTGFCLMLDNEIAYDATENLNVNIGRTRRVGAETEAAWAREWYGASTRWAFVDARMDGGENNDKRVPLAPAAYGVTSAWIEPVPECRLTVTHTYVSEQYRGNDVANTERKMDAYGLLGLRANVGVSDHLNLVFSVQNLLDEIYAASAYSGGYYPGAGRSFRVGMALVY